MYLVCVYICMCGMYGVCVTDGVYVSVLCVCMICVCVCISMSLWGVCVLAEEELKRVTKYKNTLDSL